MNEELAKLEAKVLSDAIKEGDPIQNYEVVRILSTRSKLHLNALNKHYKEICGNYLDEVSHYYFILLI